MLSVGLVGLPNAGKSSLFNLLTKRSVPAENFPFTTIDPHEGIVEVPDLRVHQLAKLVNAKKEVYAAIEFKDIAGLIKNAHQGEGLGNQFLANIQEVDLILMVLRCFENDDIIHVENRVNPQEDEEILMIELTMHDEKRLQSMQARIQKEGKKDPFVNQKLEICEHLLASLNAIKPASSFSLGDDVEPEILRWRKSLNLLTDKPILHLANINQDGTNVSYENTDFSLDVKLESELGEMTADERKELGYDHQTGLDLMIRECYKKLNLATFLTAGEMEARAWTFTAGSKAPECAGKIHTDFEKKFIKAEVASYPDFMRVGGWKNCVEQGLVKTMGKDYVMQDGDVVEFKIGN